LKAPDSTSIYFYVEQGDVLLLALNDDTELELGWTERCTQFCSDSSGFVTLTFSGSSLVQGLFMDDVQLLELPSGTQPSGIGLTHCIPLSRASSRSRRGVGKLILSKGA
jgi:hypothetical protein